MAPFLRHPCYTKANILKGRCKSSRKENIEARHSFVNTPENYLINANVIYRLITQKGKKTNDLNIEKLTSQLDILCESFKEGVIDDYATEFHAKDKSLVVKTAYQMARDYVNPIWENEKFGLIPGKKFLSSLSKWSSSEYRVNLNAFKIAREFRKSEIPKEIQSLINTIEKGQKISYL